MTTTPNPTPASLDFKANRLQMHVDEAVGNLREALLARADHELLRVNAELHDAGIDYPQGARGVRDLASLYRTQRQAIVDQMTEELERLLADSTPDDEFNQGVKHMIDFVENWPGAAPTTMSTNICAAIHQPQNARGFYVCKLPKNHAGGFHKATPDDPNSFLWPVTR